MVSAVAVRSIALATNTLLDATLTLPWACIITLSNAVTAAEDEFEDAASAARNSTVDACDSTNSVAAPLVKGIDPVEDISDT